MRAGIWSLLIVALGACGGTQVHAPMQGAVKAAPPATAGLRTASAPPPVRETQTLFAPAPRSFEVQTLSSAGPVDAVGHVGTRRRVNVKFQGASLANALAFLANAGGFSLVADSPLTGIVNAELRDVVPYQALVSLANAHGAQVQSRGRVVVVRPR